MAFFQTYTGASLGWSEAVKLVKSGEGDIFCVIVREIPKRNTEALPCYGFFFRFKDGRLADVFKNSRIELMTVRRAEQATSRLLEAYPDTWAFLLPICSDQNVVGRGQIDKQVLHRVEKQPLLGTPTKLL